MSRTFKGAKAALIASSLSLLMSQSAFASIVNIHVPTPTVRISVPTARIHAPVVHFKGPATTLRHTVVRNHRGDLPKGGKNNVGRTTSKAAPVVVAESGRDWPRGRNPGGNEWTGPWRYNPLSKFNIQVLIGAIEASNFFNGDGCTLPSSNNGPGFGHILTITSVQNNGNGSATITVSWGPQNGNPGGGPSSPVTGAITKNANGTYTITFSWSSGTVNHVFTGTISWTPGPNGGGSWTLSGGVTVNGSMNGGPGSGTCTIS